MDINTNNTNNISAQSAGHSTAQPTVMNAEFETFLKMLTTQMQNQDPLNPVDSTEFATQLATFSSVEQQVLTNDYLAAMQVALTSQDMVQAAHLIGQAVKISGGFAFEGDPVEVNFSIPQNAVSAEMVIYNQNGLEVSRHLLSPTDTAFTWDGYWADGFEAVEGAYVAKVDYTNLDGQLITDLPTTSYVGISEIGMDRGEIVLTTETGHHVRLADVQGVRSG